MWVGDWVVDSPAITSPAWSLVLLESRERGVKPKLGDVSDTGTSARTHNLLAQDTTGVSE
jgi:hypothetical protein